MATIANARLSFAERRAVDRLIALLEAELELRSVWLYGSRARGEGGGSESDVDLLIVAEGDRYENLDRTITLLTAAADEEGVNPFQISPVVWTPDWLASRREVEAFFVQEVDRDKIVLFGEA